MYALELKNITKTFGKFKANDNLSLSVRKGSIHALIGENGAGKSTLMSILFGLLKLDAGKIYINDQLVEINSPLIANKYGLGLLAQHFKLVDNFTVLENIVLNQEETILKTFISYKNTRKKLFEIMEQYDLKIDLNKKVKNCTIIEQQRIEILKMIYNDADILIFDEPTAVLAINQITKFLDALKDLNKRGKTIILISHKLPELREVAKYGTIIRRGVKIIDFNIKDYTNEEISQFMVGKKVTQIQKQYQKISPKVLFEVENLTVPMINNRRLKGLKNLNFEIHEGEIVSIFGFENNGQQELLNAIIGLKKIKSGRINLLTKEASQKDKKGKLCKIKNYNIYLVNKKCQISRLKNKLAKLVKKKVNSTNRKILKLKTKLLKLKQYLEQYQKELIFSFKKINLVNKSVKRRHQIGLSYVPADRQKHGLILDVSLAQNAIIKQYYRPPFSYWGFLNNFNINAFANKLIQNYDVRCQNKHNSLAKNLSGGNQQKFIIARELNSDANLFIFFQPTRGLDVEAVKNVHKQILKLKEENNAILIISYEIDEIIALSDRVIVIEQGQRTGQLVKKEINRENLGLLMTRQSKKAEKNTS